MKKKDIVKNQRDFSKIIKTGKKVSNNSFVIYYKVNNIGHSRYVISVGTKLGNAVFRNKYKRRKKELFLCYIHNYYKKKCRPYYT